MDVLSDVLRIIRLTGTVFLTADFSSPWALESVPGSQLMSMLMPNAAQCVIFHVLAAGRCWIKMEGSDAVEISANDVIIFPHGDAHSMCSDLNLRSTAILDVLPRPPFIEMPHLVHGGGGEVTRFICGYLHCDQKFNPLFSTLPRLLTVQARRDGIVLKPSGGQGHASIPISPDAAIWLKSSVQYLIAEATRQGQTNSALLARLAELLFVETLRLYMQHLPAGQAGWLAGLSDSHVGKSLEFIHAEPAKSWTVEQLAHAVGTSRSILAERFTALIGQSPMHYLTSWRLELAKKMLQDGTLGLSDIATRVGYRSEFAFNRAFKRYTGKPPAKWRSNR